MTRTLTISDIDRALYRLAVIIDRFGPVYLPIYERLERERADLAARDAVLDRVVERVRSGPPVG